MTLRLEQILVPVWTAIVVVTLMAAFQDWTGVLLHREVVIPAQSIDKEEKAFTAEVPTFADLHGRSRKQLTLFEDGKRFRKSMSSKELVLSGVPGTWYVAGRELYLNSSDGTSPEKNGRTYSLAAPDGLSTKAQRILQILAVILTIALWTHLPSREQATRWGTELRRRLDQVSWLEPLRRLSPQARALGGFGLLLLLVLLDVGMLWSTIPIIAIVRDDTGGFLSTALDYLAGGEFVLPWKRKFLYPAFLCGVMKVGGSLNAVAVAQIALSFVSAALIVVGTWIVAHRRTWSLFLGLGFAHVYLQCSTTVYYGLSLMGEGVSPVMILLAILGFVGFLRCRDPRWVIASWTALVINSEALYCLKPNWGFGVAFPFVALLARRLLHPDLKLIPALLYGASCVAVLLACQLINSKTEGPAKNKSSFLAQTAFIAHLKQIKPVLESDLASGKAPRPEVIQEMLDRYDEALRVTAVDGHAGYKRIGFNPNLLMNGDRSLTKLPHFSQLSAEEQNDFLMGYFIKMVTHRPFAYVAKVVGMFSYLFEEGRIFPDREEVEFLDLLEKSNENLDSYSGVEGDRFVASHRARTQAYLDLPPESRQDVIVMHEHRIFRTLGRLCLAVMFVLPVVTVISGVGEFRAKRLSLRDPAVRERIDLALIANGLLLLFLLALGTNAAIYTLKVRRYTEFVLPTSILTLTSGGLFLIGEARRWWPVLLRSWPKRS